MRRLSISLCVLFLFSPFALEAKAQPPFIDSQGKLWFYDRHGNLTPLPPSSKPISTRAKLAAEILKNRYITLATTHFSGVPDNANARQNIPDTAAGGNAHRSHYGTAPAGTVALQQQMLKGMLALAESYSFQVTEIAGGSHATTKSHHYLGVAFDIGTIDGTSVKRMTREDFQSIRALCLQLGAKKALGPGDPDHSNHIHVEW